MVCLSTRALLKWFETLKLTRKNSREFVINKHAPTTLTRIDRRKKLLSISGTFVVNVTEDRNCALYLNSTIDYETEESYNIEVQLMSLQGFINKDFSITQITVHVGDINDNKPFFIYPNYATSEKFYAAVPENAPLGTSVIQIKADDKDSGKYGKIKYILQDLNEDHYFTIDPISGIIKTQRLFHSADNQTYILSVKARDNPNATKNYHEIQTPVIVNLITDANRMILVIGDAKPGLVATKLDTLVQVIQEQSGLIVGIEKLTAREYVGVNGTMETDPDATDVWFYVVDPETEAILRTNNSLVRRYDYQVFA